MRVLLIHNSKAGDRRHSKKSLMAALIRCGHQTLYQSIGKRDWKRAFRRPVDLVIAAGGDGTVHKVAWQLMGSGIPFAILPLGTANNLARTLGFSASVDEILQSLHRGKARPFDIGAARSLSRPTSFFLEAAGGALFADYFQAAKASKKKGASPEEELAANLSLLRELALNYRASYWKMSIDGEDISDRYILWGARISARLDRRFISPETRQPMMVGWILSRCARMSASSLSGMSTRNWREEMSASR